MNHRLFRPLLGTVLVASAAGLLWYFWPTSPPATSGASTEVAEKEEELSLHLPEEERQRLWEIEHRGNVLAKHGFGPFAAALRAADAAAVARCLAPEFEGQLACSPTPQEHKTDLFHVSRKDAADADPRRLTRDDFVALLLRYRGHFAKPPSVKLAYKALSPESASSLAGGWKGTGLLRLWGERAPGKPCEIIVTLEFRLTEPTAESLALPGWLTSCRILTEQVGSAEQFLFREGAAARGLDVAALHDNWRDGARLATITGGAYVTDFDRDGFLDLLVTDVNGVFLYKGVPNGQFVNVTASVGLPEVLRGGGAPLAAFVDLDGDGWDDLLLGDAIYRNEGGRRFVSVTALCNIRFPPHSTGVAIADFDRDGRLDLYITRAGRGKANSWLTGKSGLVGGNVLLRNCGDFRFEDVTAKCGVDGDRRSTFAAVWLDADDDGWPDLYVPNEFGDGVLYMNRRDGPFRPTALTDKPCDFGTMGLTCGDIDNDGKIDLYCANMYSKAGSRVMGNMRAAHYPEAVVAKMRTFVRGSQLHRNLGDGGWEPKAQAWGLADCGWAYGAALADLDNDGWLDIHATAGYVSTSRSDPDG